jgi:hypothetical protein
MGKHLLKGGALFTFDLSAYALFPPFVFNLKA